MAYLFEKINERGADALYVTQILEFSNDLPTVSDTHSFGFPIDYFNRTPSAGETFFIVWRNTSTAKTYMSTAKILSITTNAMCQIISKSDITGATGANGTDGAAGANGADGADGKDALISKVVFTNEGTPDQFDGTTKAGFSLTSFNRTPIVGDRFLHPYKQTDDKHAVYFVTFEVTEIRTDLDPERAYCKTVSYVKLFDDDSLPSGSSSSTPITPIALENTSGTLTSEQQATINSVGFYSAIFLVTHPTGGGCILRMKSLVDSNNELLITYENDIITGTKDDDGNTTELTVTTLKLTIKPDYTYTLETVTNTLSAGGSGSSAGGLTVIDLESTMNDTTTGGTLTAEQLTALRENLDTAIVKYGTYGWYFTHMVGGSYVPSNPPNIEIYQYFQMTCDDVDDTGAMINPAYVYAIVQICLDDGTYSFIQMKGAFNSSSGGGSSSGVTFSFDVATATLSIQDEATAMTTALNTEV